MSRRNVSPRGDAAVHAAAAAEHLGMALGDVVCALLEKEPDPAWAPNPAMWHEAPEHGAF